MAPLARRHRPDLGPLDAGDRAKLLNTNVARLYNLNVSPLMIAA